MGHSIGRRNVDVTICVCDMMLYLAMVIHLTPASRQPRSQAMATCYSPTAIRLLLSAIAGERSSTSKLRILICLWLLVTG